MTSDTVHRRSGGWNGCRWRAMAGALVAAACVLSWAQEEMHRRDRGAGYYQCVSANTPGAGDLWIGARGIGHVWDDPGDSSDANAKRFLILDRNVRAFPEVRGEVGLFHLASLAVESRPLSWGYRFGWVSGALKLTWPNNRELRLHGPGAEIKYIYNAIESQPTLAGYIGFMPEGYVHKGHSLQLKALYDLDAIAGVSWLPVKVSANLGLRLPLDREKTEYSQYLFAVAVAYAGLDVDVFVEYSLEAFVSRTLGPKRFDSSSPERHWEVAFTENPMYLTPGGHFRYPNGWTLYAMAPLLLSVNQGSDMTYGGNWEKIQADFPEEKARGVEDAFDPWFVKWKVVAGINIPIIYHQTSTEMMRNFLLLKNRPQRKKIDIDERLRVIQGGGGAAAPKKDAAQQKADEEQDKKKRLEEIRKKREQAQ